MGDFQPMETAPRDGSSFDVLYRGPSGNEGICENLHYGYPPMGRGTMILWGRCNFFSPYLTPIGWRPRAFLSTTQGAVDAAD